MRLAPAIRRVLAASGLLGLPAMAAQDLAPGVAAPDFALLDQNGQRQSLGDYRGRWVVLYFYPKDDTPGCTTEACAFRDEYRLLGAKNVAVLGVSLDSSESHARFAQKFNLPFPLLADTEGSTAAAYGSLWSLGPIRFARRHSFLIDPQGKIARIYRSVEPAGHAREILHALDQLAPPGGGANAPHAKKTAAPRQ